jgi:alpha-tubulin suppressor-like RCC1 family protein
MDPPKVATIEVTPGELMLAALGTSEKLIASVLDGKGRSISGVRTEWQSSAPQVASVDSLGLVIAVVPGTATVTASAGGKSASALVTVAPAANRLVFKTEPADLVAGAPLLPAVRVEIQDANGHLVAGSKAEVTLALAGGPEGATLLGTLTARAEGGVATFEGLRIERAGSGYRLQASAEELATIESKAFAVQPAEAARLAFISITAVVEGQVPFAPALEVEVQDRFGNRTPDWTGKVTLSLEKNPGNATLAGTQTVITDRGVARFSDLSLANPGNGYTLWAEASGLSAVEGAPFDVRLTFTSVSAGWFHTCGLTRYGKAYCWGFNGYGQLGDGSTTQRLTPIAVAEGMTFAALSTGYMHTCGVTTAGRAYCWGHNLYGELGDGTGTSRLMPTAVKTNQNFITVGAGMDFTCGLTPEGSAYCWGANVYGQLGDGTTMGSNSPSAVSGNHTFGSLSVGIAHACGTIKREGVVVLAKSAYCWGANGSGRLGDGTETNRLIPAAVSSNLLFATLSAAGHTCGVSRGREVYCWGENGYGQLGDSTNADRLVPTAVSGNLTFAVVSAGPSHTCGLDQAGGAYCWGRNDYGQLGDGGTTDRLAPVAVSSHQAFAALSSGQLHSCGLSQTGEVYCWGHNGSGQLGNGTGTHSPIPVPVFGTER